MGWGLFDSQVVYDYVGQTLPRTQGKPKSICVARVGNDGYDTVRECM